MRHRILLPLILSVTALSGTADAGGSDSACRAALEAVHRVTAEARPQPEVLARYESLEELCLRPSIDTALRLEALAESAEAQWVYRKDFPSALDTYRVALAEAGAHLPEDHPVRIQLIEGLARALDSLRSQGADAPEASLPRVLALYAEAYEMNASRHGASSSEAIRALLNLSNLELQDRPDVAEDYARQAFEARRQVCGLWGLDVSVALQYLADALERQGKQEEKDRVDLLLAQVELDGESCPPGCCDLD